jgi:hypothetical protein
MEHTFHATEREDKSFRSSRTGAGTSERSGAVRPDEPWNGDRSGRAESAQRAGWLWLTVCAGGWLPAWSALDAANKGPLQTATVAATAHRSPAAAALPLLMRMAQPCIMNVRELTEQRKNLL